jgi:hypothetical protein
MSHAARYYLYLRRDPWGLDGSRGKFGGRCGRRRGGGGGDGSGAMATVAALTVAAMATAVVSELAGREQGPCAT